MSAAFSWENLRGLWENFKLKIQTLVDNFAKPVMCLLLDVIQWFMDNGIDYEPESIYSDVRVRDSILLLKFTYSEEAIKIWWNLKKNRNCLVASLSSTPPKLSEISKKK